MRAVDIGVLDNRIFLRLQQQGHNGRDIGVLFKDFKALQYICFEIAISENVKCLGTKIKLISELNNYHSKMAVYDYTYHVQRYNIRLCCRTFKHAIQVCNINLRCFHVSTFVCRTYAAC